MDYAILAAQRAKIQLSIDLLITLVQQPERQPAAASAVLARLAAQVRDHLVRAEPVFRDAAASAHGGRHQQTADAALAALISAKATWSQFIYQWNAEAVDDRWTEFTTETIAFFTGFDERIGANVAILYALALHHGALTLSPGTYFEQRLDD